MKYVFTIIGFFVAVQAMFAQQPAIWSLQDCYAYASTHNLSLQESDWDKRIATIEVQRAKANLYPSFSVASSAGLSLGRSISPTTNQFENTQFFSTGLSWSSNVLLFGWFQKRYGIQKSELQAQQTKERIRQQNEDLKLTISTAYLRALLAREQKENVIFQLALSEEHKKRMESLLALGKSNILELAQTKTQLSTDSSLYLQAQLNYEQAIIDLKTILNLDYQQEITLDTASLENLFFIETLNPENVYEQALLQYPQINIGNISYKIAQKTLQISRSGLFPQLSTYYSSGTNYSSSYKEISPDGSQKIMNMGKQFNSNLSHSFGLSLSIPVWSNWSHRANIESAKAALQQSQLNLEQSKLELKQKVFTACVDYKLSLQKYQNALATLDYATIAYRAAQVRYEAGLINSFEFLSEKTNLLKAQNELSALKYDLWFKKLLVEKFKTGGIISK